MRTVRHSGRRPARPFRPFVHLRGCGTVSMSTEENLALSRGSYVPMFRVDTNVPLNQVRDAPGYCEGTPHHSDLTGVPAKLR